MKLAILTAGVFGGESIARQKLWLFLRSCERVGIDPHIYGFDKSWSIYRTIKIDNQLEYLKSEAMRDYSHVLYSDGQDALILAGLTEICLKYHSMGAPPILVSASHQLANVSEEEKDYPGVFPNFAKYHYPHVGGWIGDKDAMIAAFERMTKNPNPTSDDCFDWYGGVRDGWFAPRLDSECLIFQVGEQDCRVDTYRDASAARGRIANLHTGSRPCVWHVPGGYSSQENGKDERMVPLAKSLGIL